MPLTARDQKQEARELLTADKMTATLFSLTTKIKAPFRVLFAFGHLAYGL